MNLDFAAFPDPDTQRMIALALITAGACGLTVVAFLIRNALSQRRG